MVCLKALRSDVDFRRLRHGVVEAVAIVAYECGRAFSDPRTI